MAPPAPDIFQIREMLRQSEVAGLAELGPCPRTIGEKWIEVPCAGRPGFTSQVKVVYPTDTSKACPLVIYLHGGGFSLGSPEMCTAPARGFASRLGCVVASPSYELTPETKFPAPMHSAWEACAWLSDPKNLNEGALKEHGVTVDTQLGFIMGGVSAGGHLAVVIGGIASAPEEQRAAATAGLTPFRSPVTGLFAGIPLVATPSMLPEDYKALIKSRDECRGQEGFNTEKLEGVEERLQADVGSPFFSPFNLGKVPQDHPRTFMYGCEKDPLRDEVVIYEKWLKEQSSGPPPETRSVIVEGVFHSAWSTMPLAAGQTNEMKVMTMDGMAWLLRREWDRSQEL